MQSPMGFRTSRLGNVNGRNRLLATPQLPHYHLLHHDTGPSLLSTLYLSILPINTATMSEVSFVKTYLSALDSRPIKLRADYVLDEEQVGPRVPVRPP